MLQEWSELCTFLLCEEGKTHEHRSSRNDGSKGWGIAACQNRWLVLLARLSLRRRRALFVRGGLVVSGDAAGTASNILAHASRFWLGLTFNLIMIACFVAVTALFYVLCKPVDRSVSLLAAFVSLMGCAAHVCSFLFYIAPLVVLQDAPHLGAFRAEQLQAMALMLFQVYVEATNIGSAFFGFYCLLIGYLVFRSAFLPRILGMLMMFAGVSWLTFLYPPLANSLRPYNLAPGILGEGSLTLWLLTMGINVERWKEQAKPGLHRTQ